jgi:tripartite-type tricarboxylate transporter receptor subunit TctC
MIAGSSPAMTRLGEEMPKLASCLIACAALTVSALSPAAAQDFYRGKNLQVYVGFDPGGGYDAYARVLARHIAKHIPGTPTVIVRNMPGAGSLTLLNHLYSIAPKDGTEFGHFDPTLIIAPLMDPAKNKYDSSKLSWVGSIAKATNTCIAWEGSGLNSWNDLVTKEASFGITGQNDVLYTATAIMRNMFGAKLRTVAGYTGTNEIRLALQRGEIQGNCGFSWNSLKTTAADLISSGKLKILAQFGMEANPELPNVPSIMDMAKSQRDKDALKVIFATQEAGRPFTAPPGVPPERLAILRAGFDATMKDPDFLEDAKKAKLDIDPVGGAAVAKLIEQIYRSPPDVIAAAKAAVQ